MADPGSGTGPIEEAEIPAGWRRFDGPGAPANVFFLDAERPDYPEKWRQANEARERRSLDRCEAARDAVAELRARWGGIDFDRLSENVVQSSEIATFTDDRLPVDATNMLRQGFYTTLRQAAERIAPLAGVSPLGALVYLTERTLPVEFALSLAEEPYTPVQIAVNAQPGKVLHLTLAPGQTMLRFSGIVRRDLTRIGRFVTEALEIANPEQRRNRGGRRALDDEQGALASPELAVRLFYWEGWSHRRIGAFFGWLKPDEDWADPKVRTRVEQRVRRYVRLGEGGLRMTDDGSEDEPWKRRPPQLERATHADERRPRRR